MHVLGAGAAKVFFFKHLHCVSTLGAPAFRGFWNRWLTLHTLALQTLGLNTCASRSGKPQHIVHTAGFCFVLASGSHQFTETALHLWIHQ